MTVYKKPALSQTELIILLRDRGLEVEDEESARLFLSQVGYYRFTTYCFPFQSERDRFLPRARFEKIERLYRLDEALRNSVFSAISSIEIFLRVRFVDGLCGGWGAFAHYARELFRSDFDQADWINSVETEITRAHEPFIEHYKGVYSGFPRLPLWMAVEVMSLGTLSMLYNGLIPDPRRRIGAGLGLPHAVLRTWMHYLSYVRNVCAHHARFWDRELAIRPDIPRKRPEWLALGLDGARSFCVLPVLEALYAWAGLPAEILSPILRNFAEIGELDPRFRRMTGIPADWRGALLFSGSPPPGRGSQT